MAFVRIGAVGDISPGNSRKFELDGAAILVANVDGTLHAIANTCPHSKGDLSRGAIREGIVTCPRHGSQFDLRTGKNVGPARILFLKIPVKDAQAFRYAGYVLIVASPTRLRREAAATARVCVNIARRRARARSLVLSLPSTATDNRRV